MSGKLTLKINDSLQPRKSVTVTSYEPSTFVSIISPFVPVTTPLDHAIVYGATPPETETLLFWKTSLVSQIANNSVSKITCKSSFLVISNYFSELQPLESVTVTK